MSASDPQSARRRPSARALTSPCPFSEGRAAERTDRGYEHWARLALDYRRASRAAGEGCAARGLATTGGARMASPEHRRAGPLQVSTLERWLYRARNERHDPVGVLRRKRRGDAGAQVSMTLALRQALLEQYSAHKSWSAQLHRDNLLALAETRPELRNSHDRHSLYRLAVRRAAV